MPFLREHPLFRSFRYRNYRLFFAGQTVSMTGTWMQVIAVGWLVYRMTGSAMALGLVSFAGQIPTFLLPPFTGVLVDRWDRRRCLLITQTLSMFQAFVLATIVLTGRATIPFLILLSVLMGIINAFDIPLRQSFTQDIVHRPEDLGNAIALNASIVNGSRLIGPSVAGLLIAAWGEGICFLLNGISYLAVLIALAAMTAIRAKPERSHPLFRQEFIEGFRHTFGFLPLRNILLLLTLISIVGVFFPVLMPIIVTTIPGGGPRTMGFLMAGSGLGALAAVVMIGSRKSAVGLERRIPFAAAAFGVGYVFFSFSRQFWPSFFLMAWNGFFFATFLASSNTVLQTLADEEKRGRVLSFYTMAFMGMAPVGSLLAGMLAHRIGAPRAILTAGVCCCLSALLYMKNFRAVHEAAHVVYRRKGLLS